MMKDSGRPTGDGMKNAMRAGGGKGKPMKPGDSGRAKGDGMKAAMGPRPKASKLTDMSAAKMRVR